MTVEFILVLLKSWFHPYGFISLLGLYLTFMFPFKENTSEFFSTRNKCISFIFIACALLTASAFLFKMQKNHGQLYVSRQNADKAAKAILQHAKTFNKNIITIGFATHGPMNFGNLSSLFIFDTEYPVNNPIVNAPGFPGISSPTIDIISYCQPDLLPHMADKDLQAKLLDDSCAQMLAKSDYFIIMGPRARMLSNDLINKELSLRLLSSPKLQPLTVPLKLNGSYDIQVLAKKKANTTDINHR